MRSLKLIGGRVAFWLGWPLWWLIMHGSERTRVLLVADGYVLLTRGTLSAGEWSLPGGGLRRGEPAATGACREVYEELGIAVSAKQVHELVVEPTHNSGIAYTARYMVAELSMREVPLPRLEVAESRWVATDEVREMRVDAATLRALELWAAR